MSRDERPDLGSWLADHIGHVLLGVLVLQFLIVVLRVLAEG